MKINIKKLTTTAKIPTRGSGYAAGYDLYADITKELVIATRDSKDRHGAFDRDS